MATNTRKKPQSNTRKSPPSRQGPSWVTLFVGIAIGAASLYFLQQAGLAPVGKPAATASKPQTAQEKNIPKPRFDFYKLLKESEVPVPVPESVRQAEAAKKAAAVSAVESVSEASPTPPVAVAAPASEEYILQAGSFKRLEDADRLRAQLILMNLTAHVEKVTVRNGDVWHRVLLGPYHSHTQMVQARDTLAANKINAIILKQSKSSG